MQDLTPFFLPFFLKSPPWHKATQQARHCQLGALVYAGRALRHLGQMVVMRQELDGF